MGVKKKGDSAVALDRFRRKLVKNALEACQEMAQVIFDRSQERVPIETGALKRSGYVEQAVEEKDRVVCKVGYGHADHPKETHTIKGKTVIKWPYVYAKNVHYVIGKQNGDRGPEFLSGAIKDKVAECRTIYRRLMTR